MESAIKTHQLTVSYGVNTALWNVSAYIPAHQVSAIIGPNGAGKSTLLKAILGMVPTVSGDIEVIAADGKPAANRAAAASSIGYVPQRSTVDWDFPITVLDLVLMGTYQRLRWFQRPGKIQREEALHALEEVQMQDFARRQIGQLSGGQQQRVFLARAFVQNASIYLLDEPFAGVDAKTEAMIVEILHRLRDAGKTVSLVHHDLTTVRRYFDHVILLNKQLVSCGPTESAYTPEYVQKAYGVEGMQLDGSDRNGSDGNGSDRDPGNV
ncbi:MAG: metal ABC transporter ATP-binding protein [Planctomycetota bacterium]